MNPIVLIDPARSAPEVPPGHWDVRARDILPGTRIRVQMCEMSPGGGAEPHIHPHQDQIFIVIDGHLEVDGPADSPIAVQSGQAVVIPAGIRHGTKNPSDSEARYIVITYAAWQEELMAARRDALPIPKPSESVLVDRTGDADLGGILSLFERRGADPKSLSDSSDGSASVVVVVSPDQENLDARAGWLAPGGTLVVVGSPAEETSLDGTEFVLTERDVVFVEGNER